METVGVLFTSDIDETSLSNTETETKGGVQGHDIRGYSWNLGLTSNELPYSGKSTNLGFRFQKTYVCIYIYNFMYIYIYENKHVHHTYFCLQEDSQFPKQIHQLWSPRGPKTELGKNS